MSDIHAANEEWYVCNCPFCIPQDTKYKFHFHVTQDVCGCFKCGYRGNFITLVSDYEGISRSEVAKRRKKSINAFRILTKEEARKEESKRKYLKELAKLYDSSTMIGYNSAPMRYLEKRGFDYSRVYQYRLREAPSQIFSFLGKKIDFSNRILIPTVENNRIVYMQARTFVEDEMKVLNPPKVSRASVGKSHVVFNLDKIPIHENIVITEGPFDAMSVGGNSVCIFGKQISTVQMYKILSKRPNEIIVWLDSGEHKAIMELAQAFSKFVKVTVVYQKEGDPGDLDDKEVKEHLESRMNTFDYKVKVSNTKKEENKFSTKSRVLTRRLRNLDMIKGLG
jgi:DNA primase